MVDLPGILKRHPYFAALPSKTLEAVARRLVVRTYKRGSLIFGEGEPAPGLYLVGDGTVRIFKSAEDGKEQVLHHISAGQSFNDVAAFDGGPSPASAQALEAATVLLLPRRTLLELMRRHPTMAEAALRTFAGRLRQMSSLVEALSLRHVTSRVAGVLLQLAREEDSTIPLPTRQELAAMVGTVREVVTRALGDLQRLGAIRLGPGRRATLLDRRTLQRLRGGGGPTSPGPSGDEPPHGARPHFSANFSGVKR